MQGFSAFSAFSLALYHLLIPLKTLCLKGFEFIRQALLKIVEEQSSYIHRPVWAQICDALEKIGGEAVVISFLKVLKSASDSNLRRLSAQRLGNLGDETAVKGLLNALEDEDSSVRYHAAKALGKLSSQEIIPELSQLLQDPNKSNETLEAAILALGESHNEEAVPELLKLLKDGDVSIRYDVIKALKEIGSATALDKLQELQKIMDDNFVYAIASIQERCQYYNYELEEERKAIATQTDGEERSLEQSITIPSGGIIIIMTDKSPTFNQQNATIGVNYAAEGSQQEFTQNVHAPARNLAEAAAEIQQLLDQLAQTYPSTYLYEFEQQIPLNARIREMLIAGGIELLKILCPPAGIPIEMGKKWLETAERQK